MQDKSERLERFKKNPQNFPFKKTEETPEKTTETPIQKRRRIIPVRFKKSKEITQTYDSVKRKNPININGVAKHSNGDAMNVLTAPTQMIINSAITALFSFAKSEKVNKKKSKDVEAPSNEVKAVEEKEILGIPFLNNKVGFPNKTSWSDVDWEWANSKFSKHPNVLNAVKSIAETAQNQGIKLLESGYTINQISTNSHEPEIKKSFELMHDKSKELFKSAFKDHSKNIKADLSEIKDIKEFVAKINVETGRKMSPLEMLVNIILLKEAKGENTEKEINGLFNYLKKENKEIDIQKCGKDFGKAVEKGIENGVLAVGKSMEVAGKALEVSGKVVESAGQGMKAIGEAAQAIPVVGNIVGGGLIAGGTAVEGAGKGIKSAGDGVSKAGESISEVGDKISEKTEKSKNPLENSDMKIIGFKEIIQKVIQIEQEIDKTSQPQEPGLMR